MQVTKSAEIGWRLLHITARNIKGQLTIEDYQGCNSLHLQTAFVNIYIVCDHCNHERIALSTVVAFKRKKSIKFKVFCVDGPPKKKNGRGIDDALRTNSK